MLVEDPNTGLPDKARGVIIAIVAGGVGYMTGKGSKIRLPAASAEAIQIAWPVC